MQYSGWQTGDKNKINSSMSYFSAGRVKFTEAKLMHLNIALASKIIITLGGVKLTPLRSTFYP